MTEAAQQQRMEDKIADYIDERLGGGVKSVREAVRGDFERHARVRTHTETRWIRMADVSVNNGGISHVS